MKSVSGVFSELRNSWNHFWFQRVESHSLCLLRIALGIALLCKMIRSYGLIRINHFTLRVPNRNAFHMDEHLGGWLMPYPYLDWLPIPSKFCAARLEELLVLLSILIILGVFTRFVMPATALLFSYLFLLSQWGFHHHMFAMMIALGVMAFTRCGDHYSLDAVIAAGTKQQKPVWILPIRLIQCLVICIYLFSTLSKLNPDWCSGYLLEIYDRSGLFAGLLAEEVTKRFTPQLRSLFTLGCEGFLVIGFLIPSLRRLAIFVGILLHLAIEISMPVGSYSVLMVALYTSFIHPASGATVILYDAKCGFCDRSRRWANALDWFRRCSWVDFRDPRITAALPTIKPEEFDLEMFVLTPDGKIRRGFTGWRWLLCSFPLTFLPGMLLYLPPIPWIGNSLYRYIAQRRLKLACPVPQASKPAIPQWEKTLAAVSARTARENRLVE